MSDTFYATQCSQTCDENGGCQECMPETAVNVPDMLATIDRHMTAMYAANAAEPYVHETYMQHHDSVLAGLFLLTGDHEAAHVIYDYLADSFSEPDYVARMVTVWMSDAAADARDLAEAEAEDMAAVLEQLHTSPWDAPSPRYETGPGRTGYAGQHMSHYVLAGNRAVCGVETDGNGTYADESRMPSHMCDTCFEHLTGISLRPIAPACMYCGETRPAFVNGDGSRECAGCAAHTIAPF